MSGGKNIGTVCPFRKVDVADWANSDLLCVAGRRELNLGRYTIAGIRNGRDLASEIEKFRVLAARYEKTALLAVVTPDPVHLADVRAELDVLGSILLEAGLANDASVLDGGTVSIEIRMICPVTAVETDYSFFPVAFCRNANNPDDPLYDPALSTPFTAINMTSDALGFALLVRERSLKAFGEPPHRIPCRHAAKDLMGKAVASWQAMSRSSVLAYAERSVRPERSLSISADGNEWMAPHNDPVFSEFSKSMHSHEMPSVYAARLCEAWIATIFEGKDVDVGRAGQSGGIILEAAQ